MPGLLGLYNWVQSRMALPPGHHLQGCDSHLEKTGKQDLIPQPCSVSECAPISLLRSFTCETSKERCEKEAG